MEKSIVVIRKPKTFYFDFHWPKDADKNFKHEIKFLIKSKKPLVENKIKNNIEQFLSKYNMETIFINTENSKMMEPHKFILNLLQR